MVLTLLSFFLLALRTCFYIFVENLLLLCNLVHYNHILQSLYTLVSQEMPSIWYTNYHNYLWSSLGWVFVHFLVILFFEWLYHLLEVEFWKTRHHKWIKNGPNSRKVIWLGWQWFRNGLNRSKNWFWTLVG